MRTIGRGGMGAVYQAKDLRRQVICAIKEISLSMVPPEERTQAIQNFKIEAQILRGLNHPNLPTFSGFFSENQRYFLVMEYIDGQTLEDLLDLNRGPFPERRVLGWARQLCDVLEYLHDQKPPIIFRDIKPGNIMLTRDGQIKLIDFGIARFFRPTGSHDTQLLGTPGFAPPEQYGKAQTDKRSDIYALAMTLFQLLTDTLSETGFGLKDIRLTHPKISPVVARALEKAAAMDPDDRYNTVAEFRRLLLGEGTFFFENGDQATNQEDLTELCIHFPEEAADYLLDGEIESWLYEIGETKLARTARHIRTIIDDPQEALERFLQVAQGSNARQRSRTKDQAHSYTANPSPNRGSQGGWFLRQTASSLRVSPRILDFGEVSSDISTPLIITISGSPDQDISGTIHTAQEWIVLSQTEFDGADTLISVRINNTALRGPAHYTGTIIISPDADNAKDSIVVVEADIPAYRAQSSWQRRGGKMSDASLDAEEEDDGSLTMGNITTLSPSARSRMALSYDGDASFPASQQKKKDQEKYGAPATTSASGWDPLQIARRQQLWLQHSFACVAAIMMGSMVYTLLSRLSPLSPGPWFILMLAGLVPATAIGASLVNREDTSWTFNEAINRICTGMGGTLLAITLIKLIWQFLIPINLPQLELMAILLIASVVSAIGTEPLTSDRIIYGTSWLLANMRIPIISLAALISSGLGLLLALGIATGWFALLSIFIGFGVAMALILRVDYLMKDQNGS
jgi:serine/threonine protein kinase